MKKNYHVRFHLKSPLRLNNFFVFQNAIRVKWEEVNDIAADSFFRTHVLWLRAGHFTMTSTKAHRLLRKSQSRHTAVMFRVFSALVLTCLPSVTRLTAGGDVYQLSLNEPCAVGCHCSRLETQSEDAPSAGRRAHHLQRWHQLMASHRQQHR
jgi:hypothetical protein